MGFLRLRKRHNGRPLAARAGCFLLGFVIVILVSDRAREMFLGPGWGGDAGGGSMTSMSMAPGSSFFRRELQLANDTTASSHNGTTTTPFDPKANNCNLTWALDLWAYEDYDARAWFACLVYIFGILFIFLGIAVVCDDFFCTSLEVICEKLNLSEQVAGATFMAAGSSAPELATSLVTVFTSRNSTGLGTILGSAVFNLVMIVAMSGLFGNGPQGKVHRACETASVAAGGPDKLPQGLFLDWRPLVRDATFYTLSLVICVVFALTSVIGEQYDDDVDIACMPGYNWWEGAILVGLYGIYILCMVKNESLMECMKKCGGMPAHIQSYLDHSKRKRDAAKLKLESSFAATTPSSSAEVPEGRRLQRYDTLSKQQSNMVVTKEEPVAPTKLDFRIHGGFEAAGHRRVRHVDIDGGRGSAVDAAERKQDDRRVHHVDIDDGSGTDADPAKSPQDGSGVELVSLNVDHSGAGHGTGATGAAADESGMQQVAEEGSDDDTATYTDATGAAGRGKGNVRSSSSAVAAQDDQSSYKRLVSLVDNSAVSDDENVSLIASEVVGLREKMVSLQGRLVPLFRLATADYKLDEDALNEEDQQNKSCCSKCCGSCMKVASWPWQCVFKVTIPACERNAYQKWEKESIPYAEVPEHERSQLELEDEDDDTDLEETKWIRGKYSKQKVDTWYARSYLYWVSFVMSIVWIWLTSWGMVDFALHLGCLINIGPYIMGLVVLAAGTSIPDTLSSIMVARDGFGDMAVANAIGSNVFNIFLGIGLPMLLTEFAWGEPFMTTGSDPAAVLLAGVMLVMITIIMIIMFVAARWVLSKPLSGFLMIFFVLYLALSIIFEAEPQLAYEPIMEWLDYKCVV